MGGLAAERGRRLMLHFAYGSNMHRAVMRKHAPAAVPLGPARLADYRFVITADGYASVAPAPAAVVHGVMWQLSPRDRVTLDLWENVAAGQYRAEMLPVQSADGVRPALVYVARRRPVGRPKPGYMEVVVKAAREWEMPADYIASLEEWLPARPLGAGHRKLGDFG
jgi:AIG2-like family